MTTIALKAGSVVYRVVEVDPPEEDVPYTWRVEALHVEQASARQIKLKGHLFKRVFKPDEVLGRFFFLTPLQAIQHFLTATRLEIDAFERKKRDAERAIVWAQSQLGKALGLGNRAPVSRAPRAPRRRGDRDRQEPG